MEGGGRAIYIPPSLNSEMLLEMAGVPYISIQRLLYRYPTVKLETLVDRLVKVDSKVIVDVDLLYTLYPRKREYFERVVEEAETPYTLSHYSLYRKVVSKYGVRGDEVYEAGFLEHDSPEEKLLLFEGSPTYAYLYSLGCIDQYIQRISFLLRDSNERYLLYYFIRYRGVGNIVKLLGPAAGMYLTRLMERGILARVGRRRGRYIVRDPAIRHYIWSRYIGGDIHKYVGFLYLIRKAFEGVVQGLSIPAEPRDVHIGEPVNFIYLDKRSFLMVDSDGGRYLIRILRGDKEDIKMVEKYPRFEAVGIYLPDMKKRFLRSFASAGGRYLSYESLSLLLSDAVGFPRRL